jgi:exopolysaccharide production protein ExoZ
MRTFISRHLKSSTQQNEIIGIQCMRYFAALAVLLDHLVVSFCESGKLPSSFLPYAYKLGDAGVFLFFAISGFVMVLTNRKHFHCSGAWLDFFLRRLIRIWPMYFAATIIVFLLKYGSDPANSFENLLKSLVFIPYISDSNLYRPILGKGWTLNYEMFFYLIFSISLAFPKRKGLALAGLILLALGFSEGSSNNVYWRFYANDIVLYFFVGLLVGVLTNETKIAWPRYQSAEMAVATAMALFLMLFTLNVFQVDGWLKNLVLLFGTFVCLFLVCFPNTKFRSIKLGQLMSILGDSSYCLYLFHGFFFFGLRPVFAHMPVWSFFIVAIIIVLLVSIGCVCIHLFCEKPVNLRLTNMYKEKTSARELGVPRG